MLPNSFTYTLTETSAFLAGVVIFYILMVALWNEKTTRALVMLGIIAGMTLYFSLGQDKTSAIQGVIPWVLALICFLLSCWEKSVDEVEHERFEWEEEGGNAP